ncbi:hypothetical protein Pint_27559 [Pistacia integerrima]|uniref:Uncharacterized protein n=1 Tax=Pistacia integerrima TaxID=434235 RepID=A0ACC0YR89_9ROSI|nr:hypothetical protein Pint_27559 [Pistacia integerrima]
MLECENSCITWICLLLDFQVFKFTNNIQRFTLHFELHKKDCLSQRSLVKLMEKHQRLLLYLSKAK